jgi:hypothetical protein
MNLKLFIAALVLSSCTAARLSVPPGFSSHATRMPVSGLNGWMINQKLSFAPYQTSKVKRGWDFSSSLQYTKFRMNPEELLAKVFLDVDTDKQKRYQHNRFQYVVQDGTLEAEVYATEKFKEDQLVYKSNNPFIGTVSKTNRYEYAFTAAVLPLNTADKEPWSVVLINKYDIEANRDRGLFSRPYVEEEGYATNGKENIAIRPIRSDKIAGKDGKETKVLGGKMLMGYELQWNNRPVVMIDILSNEIWMQQDVTTEARLILASVSSAILLKRMQDVEQDKDDLDK